MKKTFITSLLCLIICLILSTTVFAAEGKISATSVKGADVNHFTVELKVDNNPGFIAIQPSLEYDNTVLKLISVDNGEIFDGIYMKGKAGATPYDLILMDATAPENITKTGVLAKYTFEVLKNVGQTEIKINIKDTSVYGLGKDKPTFNTYTLKVDLKDVSNLPVQQNTSSATKVEQNTLSSTPQNSNTDYNVSQQNQSGDVQTNQGNENGSDQGLSQNTIILIISFGAVVIIGALVTGLAIYKKKKK